MSFEGNTFRLSLLPYRETPTACHLAFPRVFITAPEDQTVWGETIKVIAVFMRTDFQSGKHSRGTFILSTIQPFTR